MSAVITAVAGILSGAAGAMGLGGGGVLLLYLTVFANEEQLKSQGINLLFFIPAAVLAVIVYAKKGEIVWKTVFKMASAGILGAFCGSLIAEAVGGDMLRTLFAVFLIALGIKEMFGKVPKSKQ